ncbi:MAG: hypothetical protein ACRED6_03160 [Stellaceae bacterium]
MSYDYRKPPMEVPPPRLRPHTFVGCRWPVERDGRVEFCGAPRARGIYCVEHASHAEPEPEARPPPMQNHKTGRPPSVPTLGQRRRSSP